MGILSPALAAKAREGSPLTHPPPPGGSMAMLTVIGVPEIMAEVFTGPCRVVLRDPRDGRPARLEIRATVAGYVVRVETGSFDDGTDRQRETSSLEQAAEAAATAIVGLLRSGYRPVSIEREHSRPA
jgi:hypothetical protein